MGIFNPVPYPENLALVLYAAVVLYTVLIGSTLVLRWSRGPLRRLTDVRLAWAVFNYGIAANSLFFIMSDFYSVGMERVLWTKGGYLSLMLALTAFLVAVESVLPYRTRNAFALIGSVVMVLTVFWPGDILWIPALIASVVALVMLGQFFRHFIRVTVGQVRDSLRLITVGFVIGFVGFVGRSDLVLELMGMNVYMAACALLFVGLLLLGIGILGSPALDELDWPSQMLELYVVHDSGMLLYNHVFEPAVGMDRALAAAGIAGLQALLQEIMSSSEGFSGLSLGRYHILFAQGESVTGVMIAKKPYRMLLDGVRDFTRAFEILFRRHISEHINEPSCFREAEDLVRAVFIAPGKGRDRLVPQSG
ncbi:MAG: hypothetical protein QXQ81_04645 [Candidatus Thorarchaeota archaeon]